MLQQIEFNTRTLVLGVLDDSREIIAKINATKFLAMLPAYTNSELEQSIEIARQLIDLSCIEICCVGTLSSEFHDRLDSVLEEREELFVLTTSIVDEEEACEYFIFGADGAEAKLLIALVGGHQVVIKQLTTLITSSY